MKGLVCNVVNQEVYYEMDREGSTLELQFSRHCSDPIYHYSDVTVATKILSE